MFLGVLLIVTAISKSRLISFFFHFFLYFSFFHNIITDYLEISYHAQLSHPLPVFSGLSPHDFPIQNRSQLTNKQKIIHVQLFNEACIVNFHWLVPSRKLSLSHQFILYLFIILALKTAGGHIICFLPKQFYIQIFTAMNH